MGLPEQPDLQVQQALPELPEVTVLPVRLVQREVQVPLAAPDQLVLRVYKE
jgi:hypothetical protein